MLVTQAGGLPGLWSSGIKETAGEVEAGVLLRQASRVTLGNFRGGWQLRKDIGAHAHSTPRQKRTRKHVLGKPLGGSMPGDPGLGLPQN